MHGRWWGWLRQHMRSTCPEVCAEGGRKLHAVGMQQGCTQHLVETLPACCPFAPAPQLVILLLLAMQGATGALTSSEAELTWRLQVGWVTAVLPAGRLAGARNTPATAWE